MTFLLHSRLEADTAFVADWPLCRVLLMNDARYPWLILAPRLLEMTEITDITAAERTSLMEEMVRAGGLVRGLPGVAKLNVGALGNLVPQLHVHVVGRRPGDPAWPGPVWGHSDPARYSDPGAAPLVAALRKP